MTKTGKMMMMKIGRTESAEFLLVPRVMLQLIILFTNTKDFCFPILFSLDFLDNIYLNKC